MFLGWGLMTVGLITKVGLGPALFLMNLKGLMGLAIFLNEA